MSEWTVWKEAFDRVTLRKDGDSLEVRGANDFGLDVQFPNYEIFWRYHVVPATNRPGNIYFRQYVNPTVTKICSTNHSIFVNLVNASESLHKINGGNLGGDRFRNCTDFIKCAGDALQLFTEMQKLIETDLANALCKTIQLWSQADWRQKWCPAREKVIGYRNFLTHVGFPQVMQIAQANEARIPFVLHPDYVIRGSNPTWPDLEKLYQTNPEKWAKLVDVCNLLNRQTMRWLDDAYGEVITALNPFLSTEDYQYLWGWDTPSHGTHTARQGGAVGVQGPIVCSPAASGQSYP